MRTSQYWTHCLKKQNWLHHLQNIWFELQTGFGAVWTHHLQSTFIFIHISHHKLALVMNDAYSNPALPSSPGSQCLPLSEDENEPFSLSQMTPLVSTAACWGRDCPRGLDASSCLSQPLTSPGNLRNTSSSSVSTLSTPPVREDYWVSGLLKCPLWPREKGHTITCEYPQLLWVSVLPVQLQSLWAFVLTWWKRNKGKTLLEQMKCFIKHYWPLL